MAAGKNIRKRKSPRQTTKTKQEISKEDDQSSNFQLYSTLFGAFTFSCICTAIIWYIFLRERGVEFSSVHTVEIITLPSPQTPFAADIIKRKTPVVLKNSIITQWDALRAWSPNYLESKLSQLQGIYENDNRWFGPYYDTKKPLTQFTNHVNPYKTNVTLSSKEFFRRIQNPINGRYHYLSGDISQLGEWALQDIFPIDELLSPNPAHSSINIWIGQPHVIAHCHYDGYHNFYAQLYGTKKFTMFKPTNWPGLYPYPFLHPSHAQAQINISNPSDVKQYPLILNVESHEVILEPGDLLYMPPLWFHHVESMDVSISVNVWTDTEQTKIMEKIFSLNIPFNEVSWHGDHLQAIAGSAVVYKAIESVCQQLSCVDKEKKFNNDGLFKTSGHYFMSKLYHSRFAILMKQGVLYSNYTEKQQRRKSLLCENDHLPPLFFQGIAQKLVKTSLEKFLKRLPYLIKGLPQDTWEIWFGNYIEYLAANAVTDLRYIGVFLKHFDTCIEHFNSYL